MSEFRMPSLGADMEAGTVVEWRVHPGDAVKRGDIVALVETEKGLIEVEIFESGVVDTIVVPEGSKVPVGTVLATIHPATAAAQRSSAPQAAVTPQPEPEPPPPPPPVAPLSAPSAPAPPAPRVHVSPLARTRAADLGVDLRALRGTGEAGAITVADVERAAAAAVPPPPPAARAPASAAAAARHAAMRHAIAMAMARSKREIPHYYLGTRIDMTRAVAWLAAENSKRPVTQRLLHSALLIRAVALAVHEVPEMNGFWMDGAFTPGVGVHVGVAISLRQGGLVAPAIHDADTLDLDALMRAMLDLVKRARAGVLRSSEISDATITVTNLGEQGVETVFGVIYPPQVALVGFGALTEQPWAANGMVGARPVISASLAADHRASDGHRGGRFLAAIDRLLQAPEDLCHLRNADGRSHPTRSEVPT
jgi:pyruvate dehydrogenase E2 component (dihydrolipoamide acetyltransferase)